MSQLFSVVALAGSAFIIGHSWAGLHPPMPKLTIEQMRHVAAETFSHNDEVVFAEQAVLAYQQGCVDAGQPIDQCTAKTEAFKRQSFRAYLDKDGAFVFNKVVDGQ